MKKQTLAVFQQPTTDWDTLYHNLDPGNGNNNNGG